MNQDFIADSSVGVAWTIASQARDDTDLLLEQVTAGASLVVPVLWPLEIANALLVLLRRKRILAKEHQQALAALANLALVVDDEGPRRAWSDISTLAAEHGLTVYDATYLELASRRRLPLATLDTALRKAAQACRISLL
jgi:predicted nucleic acid-binding protein